MLCETKIETILGLLMHVITPSIPNYTPSMLRVYENQIYKPSPPPLFRGEIF